MINIQYKTAFDKECIEKVVSEMSLKKDYNKEEPEPKNTMNISVWNLVLQDMKDRNEDGKIKYGCHLNPFNGRDPLLDLYQELLDAVVYLRQLLYEKYNQ